MHSRGTEDWSVLGYFEVVG